MNFKRGNVERIVKNLIESLGQLEEYLVCPSCGSELIFPFEKLDDAAADVGIAVMRTESARNGRHEPFSTTTTGNYIKKKF